MIFLIDIRSGVNQLSLTNMACLAKASKFLSALIPPHKWDGNELCYHCRWLQPTGNKDIYQNAALAKFRHSII